MSENFFLVQKKDLDRLVLVEDQPQWLQRAVYQAFWEEKLHLYIIDKQIWIALTDLQRIKKLHDEIKEEKQKVGEHNASQIIQAISPEKVAASTKEDRPEEVVYA